MSGNFYVGIDPGLSGAVAALLDEDLMVYDLPVVEYKAGKHTRRRLDARSLGSLIPLERASDLPGASVIIEDVHSMPGQGVSSTFGFGRACGVIEGVVAARGFSYRFVTSQKWKKAMDIPKDKDAARLAVIQRYPESAEFLTRKKDHNRAEAIALAYYLKGLGNE